MASDRKPSAALVHRRPVRLWFSAFVGVLLGVVFLLTPIFLALGFLVDKSWLIWAIASLATIAIGVVAFLLMTSRIHCRVCGNPLLLEKHCNKHPQAKTLLGSYVLKASLTTATRGVCRCMYCNEPNFSYGGRSSASRQEGRQEAFRLNRESFELDQAIHFQQQLVEVRRRKIASAQSGIDEADAPIPASAQLGTSP